MNHHLSCLYIGFDFCFGEGKNFWRKDSQRMIVRTGWNSMECPTVQTSLESKDVESGHQGVDPAQKVLDELVGLAAALRQKVAAGGKHGPAVLPSFRARALYAVRSLPLCASIAALMTLFPNVRGSVLLPVSAILAYAATVGGAALAAKSLILGTIISMVYATIIISIFSPSYYVTVPALAVYSFVVGMSDADLVLQRMANASLVVALMQWSNPVLSIRLSDLPQILLSISVGAFLAIAAALIPLGFPCTAHWEYDVRHTRLVPRLQHSLMVACAAAVRLLLQVDGGERFRSTIENMDPAHSNDAIAQLLALRHNMPTFREELARMSGCLDEIALEKSIFLPLVRCSALRNRYNGHLYRREITMQRCYALERAVDRLLMEVVRIYEQDVRPLPFTTHKVSGDPRDIVAICKVIRNLCICAVRGAVPNALPGSPAKFYSRQDWLHIGHPITSVIAELRSLEQALEEPVPGVSPQSPTLRDRIRAWWTAAQAWDYWLFRLRRGLRISLAIVLASIFAITTQDVFDSTRFIFWAPLTVSFVLSSNVGGFFHTSALRLQGTMIGSVFSYILLQFTRNVYVLASLFTVYAACLQYPRSNTRGGYWAVVASLTAGILVFAFRLEINIEDVALARLTQTFLGVAIMIVVWAAILPVSARKHARDEVWNSLQNVVAAAGMLYTTCSSAAESLQSPLAGRPRLRSVSLATGHRLYNDSAILRMNTATVVTMTTESCNLTDCNSHLVRSRINFNSVAADINTEPQLWFSSASVFIGECTLAHRYILDLTSRLLCLDALVQHLVRAHHPSSCKIYIRHISSLSEKIVTSLGAIRREESLRVNDEQQQAEQALVDFLEALVAEMRSLQTSSAATIADPTASIHAPSALVSTPPICSAHYFTAEREIQQQVQSVRGSVLRLLQALPAALADSY